jgi:hypothetical protein
MSRTECVREVEVLEAVTSGNWTDELRSHAASCAVCTDVVEVADALHNDYAHALLEAKDVHVPSAGLVWWRSELRARREAMKAAERPITLAHAFGGACAVGVLIAVLAQMSPWLKGLLPAGPFDAVGLLSQHVPLVLMLGAVLVLAPVALYFVFSDK